MKENENQIVVYQPDEVMRLEVRLENETVWLNQSKLGELFGVDRTVVNRHIRNIYLSEELVEAATCAKIAQVQIEGGRRINRTIPFYNLDMIIAVGYRVNSKRATKFRQWATGVLRDYLLKGYAVNARLAALEDKVDRRLGRQDHRIDTLEQQVDFFVKTNTPPTDIAKFNAQYGPLTLKKSAAFHDRFLILDDKELYLIGASLKGLGKKCFGFTKMDANEIAGIKARV